MLDLPLSDAFRNVLVAPLHWGLGHASRCIPIIRSLLKKGKTVVIASDSDALELLVKEFPTLPSVALPPYDMTYPHTSMVFNMLTQAPKLWQAIRAENVRTAQIVRKFNIDTIISDNRYGVRNNATHNIIICHQINIQHPNPLAAVVATRINRFWINRFDACWIPDFPPPDSIAGIMSYPEGLENFHYIGPQSRMEKLDVVRTRKYLAILSGPEPSRTNLENILIRKLQGKDYLLVRGIVKDETPWEEPIINYLTSHDLNREICASEIIICRAGYSSIMDLLALDKKAILIPTPGQPEQEFLGTHLKATPHSHFTIVREEELKVYPL